MFQANPNTYMILYTLSIVATYLLVRLRIASIPATLVVGMLSNSFFMFLYSIARGNSIEQAITVGLVLGSFFSVIMVALAAVFAPKKAAVKSMNYVEDKVTTSSMAQ